MKRVEISSADRRQLVADRGDDQSSIRTPARGHAERGDAGAAELPPEAIDRRLAAWVTDGGRAVASEPLAVGPDDAPRG